MFLFLYQEFIHKKQYCYVVFDILDFVVKKSKEGIWIVVWMFAILLRRSDFVFFYLDFYQGPSKLNLVWNMQFFFVQVKAARGILKLIHELIQTELQNPSGEAQLRQGNLLLNKML